MSSRIFLSVTMAAVSLIFATGCSHQAKKKSPDKTAVAAKEIGGTHYTTIEFKKGTTKLTEASKVNLNSLTTRAHRSGREIDEIKVLAWADQEYPDKVHKAPTREVILAKERANNIKKYLSKELHESEDIEAFNMAKRPNLVSKLFKNEDYDVKEAFEQTGATGTRLNDGSVSYSKASKAIVIIDYEDNTTTR